MSVYDAERIEKPAFFGIRPTSRGRGKRIPYVIGFDSEADDSRPFLFQFSEPEMSEEETMVVNVPPDDHAGMRSFMQYVCRRLMGRFGRKHEIIIYGWNLGYEWTQLFHDMTDVADQDEVNIEMTVTHEGHDYDFTWTVYNDKRVFAKLVNERAHLQIRILDGMMFYKSGLDAAAKMLGLGEKYKANDDCKVPGAWHEHKHDNKYIDRSLANDPEFLLYARRDAYITRLVGQQIVGLHEDYDIPQTISAPHFAATVFKRQFLTREVELPEAALEQIGLNSYHGGKNGKYVPDPIYVPDCYQVDITSAYPEAMHQLPNIEEGIWRPVSHYTPGRHAIYVITGKYDRCTWRGMQDHDGSWPMSGYLDQIAVTSYELDAMVERGEFRIIACYGWEFIGEPGGPLQRFVDTFFAQKASTTGVARETAKLLLNSLYGKFFQKVSLGLVGYYDFQTGEMIEHNPDGMYDWRAGGLYHPPIASLITGFVRAKIHRLEHRYESIMTSTDGMFAMKPPDPAEVGKGLGQLTCERGELKLWRERLYVFRSPSLEKPKAAYHGWWGTLDQLCAVPLEPGTYSYTSRHMVTLKESLHEFSMVGGGHTRYQPGTFAEVPRTITL